MAPALAAAGIVDALEELGKGSYLCGAERHLRHSMSQAGVDIGDPKPDPRASAQGMKEHQLGPGVLAVAGPAASEAARAPDLDPVGRAVDPAPEEFGVDEGLRQEHVVTEVSRPVPHQTARVQREHARAEVALAAGENQEARVVGDQVQTAELDAAVPADPVIARPTFQRRRREHQKRQSAPSMVRDIAHGLAHPRHRAEVVVCLHQVAEASLVLRRHDIDRYLRKNRHGFPVPTAASRHSHQDTGGKSTISGNALAGMANGRSTNPPCKKGCMSRPKGLNDAARSWPTTIETGQLTIGIR